MESRVKNDAAYLNKIKDELLKLQNTTYGSEEKNENENENENEKEFF